MNEKWVNTHTELLKEEIRKRDGTYQLGKIIFLKNNQKAEEACDTMPYLHLAPSNRWLQTRLKQVPDIRMSNLETNTEKI